MRPNHWRWQALIMAFCFMRNCRNVRCMHKQLLAKVEQLRFQPRAADACHARVLPKDTTSQRHQKLRINSRVGGVIFRCALSGAWLVDVRHESGIAAGVGRAGSVVYTFLVVLQRVVMPGGLHTHHASSLLCIFFTFNYFFCVFFLLCLVKAYSWSIVVFVGMCMGVRTCVWQPSDQ